MSEEQKRIDRLCNVVLFVSIIVLPYVLGWYALLAAPVLVYMLVAVKS